MPVARYGGNNIVPACTDTAVGTYVTLQLIVSCSTHTEDCYEEQDVLVCTKEETPGHTHTEACYSTAFLNFVQLIYI